MAWRNCRASLALVTEINQRWPVRDKASDGTIGDAAHATRTSDHNPWVQVGGQGVVRARDVDKDGIDAAWCVEHLRTLGSRRDQRLYPGGYLIFNRRITTPDFSEWKAYTGANPHEHHFHVSFSTVVAGFDSDAPWGIWPAGSAALPRPTLRLGDTGPAVADLQRLLSIPADGDFGPLTDAAVRRAQQSHGLAVDGIAGPATWAALTPKPAPPSPTPRPVEDDDMTPDQDRMLRLVFDQLAGPSSTPEKFTGWPAWGGGSGETLTAVDYLRRANVDLRALTTRQAADLAAVRAEVSSLAKQVGELVAVVRAGGGSVPATAAAFEFTGTATPRPA